MRIVYLNSDSPYIIGKQGETNAVTLRVDVTEWATDFPNGTGVILFTRPNKVIYPLETGTIVLDGKTYLQTIVTTKENKVPGWVVLQAQWYNGDVLVKSMLFSGKVLVSGDGTTVDPTETVPSWVTEWMDTLREAIDGAALLIEAAETMNEDLEASHQAVSDSEAWARGTRSGEAVEPTDETYHNNSKYYSEQIASTAEDVEAWANGTRHGTDIDETDPAYHKNGKYYNTQAAASAAAAAASASEAMTDTPEGYANVVASISPTYDGTKTYAMGAYCLNGGKLYRCTTAIDEPEAVFNSAHWTEVNVGGEVSDLKSAFVADSCDGLMYSKTMTGIETITDTLPLEARKLYRIVVDYAGVNYTIRFVRADGTYALVLVDSYSQSLDTYFWLTESTPKIRIWANSPTGSDTTVRVYDVSKEQEALYNAGNPVTVDKWMPQTDGSKDYIANVKKGDFVTLETNVNQYGNVVTATFFNTDTYSSSEPTNYKFYDSADPTRMAKSFVADRDYKYLHLWRNGGSITKVSITRQKMKNGEVPIIFADGAYYPGYKEANGIANRIRTQLFGGSGLYLVTFPDGIQARYFGTYYDGTTASITLDRPFSVQNLDTFGVFFQSKDGSISTSSDLSGIKIWHIANRDDYQYDAIIAASDSTPQHKLTADIVCDGANDTDILAALFGCDTSVNVLLRGGHYNITKMWTHSNTAKVALGLNERPLEQEGSSYRRYITIHGDKRSTPQTVDGVYLVVSQALHNSLSNSGMYYFIIGAPYSVGEEVPRISTSVDIANINIIGYKYDKPITYVDTTRCLSTMLESVNVRSWAENLLSYNPFNETPNSECCGIRVGRGSNYGIQNYVKHSNVWYCYKGLSCCGEHFVFEDVKAHHDYIGFVFGDRNTVGRVEHPNVMIGCAIEGCYRLMLLTKMGVTTEQDFVEDYANKLQYSTLVVIGTSTETVWDIPVNERTQGGETQQNTLPIKEILRGCYMGSVEIDGWWSPTPFEQDGSGKNMLSTWHSGGYSIIRRGGPNVVFDVN